MSATTVTTLQSSTNIVLGELRLVWGTATAPRKPSRALQAVHTLSPGILSDLKLLARRDLSAIEDVAVLMELLHGYRQIAEILEHILEQEKTEPNPRIREWLATPEQIEAVLEAIEEKIEDLEIATNPDVHAAIEHLIAEVTPP